MAFGKKFDKNKAKEKLKRKQQNPLFKRKKFCRFTAAGVEQVDYKDVDTLMISSRKTARSCRHV
jgi:small subunit ribosomal protein S18